MTEQGTTRPLTTADHTLRAAFLQAIADLVMNHQDELGAAMAAALQGPESDLVVGEQAGDVYPERAEVEHDEATEQAVLVIDTPTLMFRLRVTASG